MNKVKRIAALLLSVLMVLPMQGITTLAGIETANDVRTEISHANETTPSDAEEGTETTWPVEQSEGERIEKILPLESLGEEIWDGSPVIYWNPGGSLPEGLVATPSDSTLATPSVAAAGSDQEDGLTPAHPVKSLETALRRAEELAEQEGIEKSEITIYAMNPMEIGDRSMYRLNPGTVQIQSWPGRRYDNDTIFYLNGGQLTLMNANLKSGRAGADSEAVELIRVSGGSLQIGKQVQIDGRIVMDYRQGKATDSNAATMSDASSELSEFNGAMNAAAGIGFDQNDYIISTEENEWDLLEDRSPASTWKAPIIELIDGFDGAENRYLLDIRGNEGTDVFTLVKTLYADEVSKEDFAEAFRLVDEGESEWDLIPASETAATTRDTGLAEAWRYYSMMDLPVASESNAQPLTRKTLSATRAGEKMIYWNPGPGFTHNGVPYPAGRDTNVDGTTPDASVKTLNMALGLANGGTIVVMQTLDLGSSDAGQYLTEKEGDAWLVKSTSTISTLKVWDVTMTPFFRVPAGQKLILQEMELEGVNKNGASVESQAVLVDGGDLTIRKEVTADSGYIQIKATSALSAHPVQADSTEQVSVKLFFSGINDNLSYRYMDVVVPTENLLASGATAEEQTAMGQTLMNCYSLARANRSTENGGNSRFDWALRPDQADDDHVTNDQKLELYTIYYYDAVYLDPIRGNDSFLGATCSEPVKTWARAADIWRQQMNVSIAARNQAYTNNPNLSKEQMNQRYPYPETIYLCSTVQIGDTQIWELLKMTDYDGTKIEPEVASHRDILNQEGGTTPVHPMPSPLVRVTGSGNLTLKDMKFRNNTDLSVSQTIQVDGGTLRVTGTTTMIGAIEAGGQQSEKEITRGTHIQAINGADVTLDRDWTGSIEGRQQGVEAAGTGTTVTMDSGIIRNNDVYDAAVASGSQKKGAGVSLSSGAHFVMNGGSISENKTYQHGGGVFLTGSGTTFTMNAGEVTGNTISEKLGRFTSQTYGLGIYADTGTIVQIGTEDAISTADARVSGNKGYVVYGGGIYANGTLNIKKAEISDNTGDSSIGKYITSTSSSYYSYGVGIYISANGTLTMDGARVSGNKVMMPAPNHSSYYETGYGMGVYIGSSKANNIQNSEISGNTAGRSNYNSYGGAIYNSGKLDIESTMISGNRAYKGGGIYVTGSSAVLNITDCAIRENITSNDYTTSTAPSVSGEGGGVWNYYGTVTITDSTIEKNKSSSGGGIYNSDYGKLLLKGTTTNGVKITKNTGDGILHVHSSTASGSYVGGENLLISENIGSGIYASKPVYFRNAEISRNTNSGVYTSGGGLYFEDVRVENNTTAGNGGGIYLNSSLYWSQTRPGGSSLKGNHAKGSGGGIYSSGSSTARLDFYGEIQNSAETQGSNLYMTASGIELLKGTLKQPGTLIEGVYNVYLSVGTSAGTSGLALDPQEVLIEKKPGSSPDAIYLNTGNSFLRYYRSPADPAAPSSMPVDVNEDVFKAGSLIVKPANASSVTVFEPNVDLTASSASHTIDYGQALKDASINLSYIEGGKLARRMVLGGAKDGANSQLTNVVLMGEGVYLAGPDFGGSDRNGGSSPQDAVATFEKAKEVLKDRIQGRKAVDDELPEGDQLGFSPIIYLCGTVPVIADETWSLDYDDPLYTETNQAYGIAEKAYNPDLSEEDLKAQLRRLSSFVSAPLIQVGQGSSTVAFQLDKIILDGMAEAVVTGTQGSNSPVIRGTASSVVTLTGDAQIRNNYSNGIVTAGKVILDGQEGQVNKQLKGIEGRAVDLNAAGAELEMKGYSRIVIEAPKLSTSRYGVYAYTSGTNDSTVTMKDHSAIESIGLVNFTYGIYSDNFNVRMEDFAQISEASHNVYLEGTGKEFSMNGNIDADEADSAQLLSATYGIYVGGKGWKITMGKQSGIANGNTGIVFYTNSSVVTKLEMLEDSIITGNSSYGIRFLASNNGPIDVTMKGNSSITKNRSGGIVEDNSGRAADRLNITMEGYSRISANGGYGIGLLGDSWSGNSYQNVILKDNAMVGGTSKYNASDTTGMCGNGAIGIYTQGPTNISLQGNSTVQYNNGYGIATQREGSSYRPTGTSMVTLDDSSSVNNNRGMGIYNQQYSASLLNEMHLTVKGNAVIQDNGTDSSRTMPEVYLNPYSELRLENGAEVSKSVTNGYAIYGMGKIYMDGTVTVDGRIYLGTGTLPLTLTSAVTTGNTYRLDLAEGFVGKNVLIPDGTAVTDATIYLSNYRKEAADGIAASKALIAAAPNIMLQGENNVYLSGSGNDNHEGSSPTTAVRTFAKARELLRTGRFTEGANIIICNSVVTITTTSGGQYDTDWSFDSDGTVTNLLTGAKWTPMVQRYASYTGKMIQVDSSRSVTFKNITIDGNKEKVVYSDSILYVYYNGRAVLEEGAVLQNNSANYSYTAGVEVYGGNFEMNGGIIQGMRIRPLSSYNNLTSPVASAVRCRNYNTNYPGTFTLKSGQIRNNVIMGSSDSYYVSGAAVSIWPDSSFYMSGGTIGGNENYSGLAATNSGNSLYGAGLYVYNGFAKISGGAIRDNTGNMGSAICYFKNGSETEKRGLVLSGGQVTGNGVNLALGKDPIGVNSPIYVEGPSFQLEGGGCDIRDAMYLSRVNGPITVSGDIYQTGRQYQIYLNQGTSTDQYQKGSIVIAPDGSKKIDVTPYQSYFKIFSSYLLDPGQLDREIQSGSSVKENQTLLLMQGVFLDGEKGDDTKNGSSPGNAVKTFSKAKAIGESGYGGKDYYVIYISGKTGSTAADTTWNMAAPAYLCRYTGFPLYQDDGKPVEELNLPYYGYLLEPQTNLTLERLALYGRRAIDSAEYNGESLLRIPAGVTVTISAGADGEAIFGRNRNIGTYIEEGTGLPVSLSKQGGAIQVAPGGTLVMNAGRVSGTEATFGDSIYLGADTADTAHLILNQSPAIGGSVYLAGIGTEAAAYVEAQTDYRPASPLKLAIGNDYNGRPCISFPSSMTPGETEMDYFTFEDSINGLYEIIYRSGTPYIIELNQRGVIYLDGVDGDDREDGKTPGTAFRTLKQIYTYVNQEQTAGRLGDNGAVVYVVDTVTLDQASAQNVVLNNVKKKDQVTQEMYYEGYYTDDFSLKILVKGQVYFKRYARPIGYDASDPLYEQYGKPTLLKELFFIGDGGNLNLQGVYLDGHAQENASQNPLYTAAGVEAMGPLVTVVTGGTLEAQYEGAENGNISTSTLFLNNVNVNRKSNQIGTLNGSAIYEGSSAGIELLGGSGILNHAEFRNLVLGENVVAGGSDVYTDGTLRFKNETLFTGVVFLEGMGTVNGNQASSRYLQVDAYGTPSRSDFQLLMRDSYMGRKVVEYPVDSIGMPDAQIGIYRLEERVKDFFYLAKKSSSPYLLELVVPSGVYVDGINGSDDVMDINAGSNPKHPVKSLKRAYELMKIRSNNTVHVVGTVLIDANTRISGTQYVGPDGTVNLSSTSKVTFARYIQPDFAQNGTETEEEIAVQGYDVDDYKGLLFRVRSGNQLIVGSDVYFDGHSEETEGEGYLKETTVTRKSTSQAPLIAVEENASVELTPGSVLQNNNNGFSADQGGTGVDGGAIHNKGTVTVTSATFENNHAKKGDAAFQRGTFTIQRGVETFADQSFYLDAVNSGTEANPSWNDSVLQLAEAVPDDQTFDIDLTHAVPGRDVIRFTDSGAYAPDSGADGQHGHFILGSTVSDDLFLAEAESDEAVLKLQNWKILNVEVPANIYLAVNRKGSIIGSTKLSAIKSGTQDLLSTPEYEITNHGRYDVKVHVNGMDNQSTAAGITEDPMILKNNEAAVIGSRDLYLAAKGKDTDGTDGFPAAEIPLLTGTVVLRELGQLKPGSTGTFEFIGKVGTGFVDKYKDPLFPLAEPAEHVQDYLDGTGNDTTVHSRAKYLLKYKVELVTPRR